MLNGCFLNGNSFIYKFYFLQYTIYDIRNTVFNFLDLEKKLCYTIFDFMGELYINYNDL